MHTLEIPEAGIYREYPSELEELSPKQFLYFTELFLQLLEGRITLHGFRVKLAAKFLNLKKTARHFALVEEKADDINDNLSRIAAEMDSFLNYGGFDASTPLSGRSPERDVVTIKMGFTKNLLPAIGNLYGPDDHLQNCTGFEYKEANSAFKQFVTSLGTSTGFDSAQPPTLSDQRSTDSAHPQAGIEHLDRLIAILYRPRKKFLWLKFLQQRFDGECRVAFTPKSNPKLLEKRQRKVSKLPFHVKYGVFLIFQAFEEFLRSGEIEIDGNAICLADLYKGGEEGNDSGIGMMGLFYELAESKVFGDLDQVMNTNIYDIFTRIYQLVRMSENLKKQTENVKNSHV
ncbi:MAG: hypothetical protein NTZ33_14480 [Bacteroidetes bacterium]|nr:hypothetical protein [Bacteroidota bacterium]